MDVNISSPGRKPHNKATELPPTGDSQLTMVPAEFTFAVLDDDHMCRRTMEFFITNYMGSFEPPLNYKVLNFASGNQVIDHFSKAEARDKPFLMFVDYQLEDMIGLQVVEALKLQPIFQDGTTKFILVSGIEEDIEDFETYFSYRLKKPLKLQDFDMIMSLIFEKEPSEV